MTSLPAIKTINLNKFYGSFHACKDISLEVQRGDVFAFIGPNGAGKTTTIKMLTGILKPNSGETFINGISLSEDPEKAKNIIGFVPDRPFLYEKLSGKEFLFMVRDIFSTPRKTFMDLYNHYIEIFEIKDWIDELIENYSHGMKQKLILTSALAHDPEIIIMDEPHVGLDPKSVKILKKIILALSAKGKTFFISTHILSLVDEVCRNMAIIQKGRIIVEGNIEEAKKSRGASPLLEDFFLEITEES